MKHHHLLLLAALVCIGECEARKARLLTVKTKGSKGHKNYFVRLKKGVPSSERKVQNNDRKVQKNYKREKKTERNEQKKDKAR